jgi:hypothetical protein
MLSDIHFVASQIVPCITKIEEIDHGEKLLPKTVRETDPLVGIFEGLVNRVVGELYRKAFVIPESYDEAESIETKLSAAPPATLHSNEVSETNVVAMQ